MARTTRIAAAERYDAGNLLAARIVLADVARYGGEDAGLVCWARAVQARLTAQQAVTR